ncbi:putative thioredoxin [Allochromatium warmingii]|uniref:Putative thioredoxin n=1 Tax=Allochromatium warmingii TaxID=61595 RepID=A0A1H3E636_ALLWA|nr:putative thioredoxin [Allochromatium warmingii]
MRSLKHWWRSTVSLELVNDPEVTAVRGQLRFASATADAPSEPELITARLAANPRDSAARYQLAAYCVLRGEYEAALEYLEAV